MDVDVLMKDNGAVGVNILTKVYRSREASDVLQIKLVFVTAFRYKFGSFVQQVVAVGLNNHEFFGQAKVASFRRVVVGPGSCNNGPFYVEVYRVVLQLPDVFGQFSAVSVFSVSECNLVLIKSLFKSSFGQSHGDIKDAVAPLQFCSSLALQLLCSSRPIGRQLRRRGSLRISRFIYSQRFRYLLLKWTPSLPLLLSC